jgi:hypothetical protein
MRAPARTVINAHLIGFSFRLDSHNGGRVRAPPCVGRRFAQLLIITQITE